MAVVLSLLSLSLLNRSDQLSTMATGRWRYASSTVDRSRMRWFYVSQREEDCQRGKEIVYLSVDQSWIYDGYGAHHIV